ncbi:hypothetical protein J4558_07765 [Leptolyngbya sp. 15MV]|nr:hypothetical protein J4558_07765 [Leptolyngbya sp. 15MV]
MIVIRLMAVLPALPSSPENARATASLQQKRNIVIFLQSIGWASATSGREINHLRARANGRRADAPCHFCHMMDEFKSLK